MSVIRSNLVNMPKKKADRGIGLMTRLTKKAEQQAKAPKRCPICNEPRKPHQLILLCDVCHQVIRELPFGKIYKLAKRARRNKNIPMANYLFWLAKQKKARNGLERKQQLGLK